MWIETTPFPHEVVPPVGSKWVNKKIEDDIINDRYVSVKTRLHLVIVIEGAFFRDDEVDDSLQVSYRVESDIHSKVSFMADLGEFYAKYRQLD